MTISHVISPVLQFTFYVYITILSKHVWLLADRVPINSDKFACK